MLKTILATMTVATLGISISYASPAPVKPAYPAPAPFSLVDTNGKTQTLAGLRGRPVVLFFFCGCNWCAAEAKQWGQMQHQGALASGSGKSASDPTTVVVFTGDADSEKSFADQTGLDLKNTVLLPDPTMKVTMSYKSETCPRVFVISPSGKVAYTNNHKDDAPRQAPAEVIADLALSAARGSVVVPKSGGGK